MHCQLSNEEPINTVNEALVRPVTKAVADKLAEVSGEEVIPGYDAVVHLVHRHFDKIAERMRVKPHAETPPLALNGKRTWLNDLSDDLCLIFPPALFVKFPVQTKNRLYTSVGEKRILDQYIMRILN